MSDIELYKKNVIDVVNTLVQKCTLAHRQFQNDDTKKQLNKAISMQKEYSAKFFQMIEEENHQRDQINRILGIKQQISDELQEWYNYYDKLEHKKRPSQKD